MSINALDLTHRPPRSPRVRLGGFVILPRMLDKGRATLAGKPGEYHYNCPLDQHFINFAGIDAEALLKQLAEGKGDGEILDWILEHAANKPNPAAIASWSSYQDHRAPDDTDGRQFLQEEHLRIAPKRADIVTWFDLLDLDDFFSFGGKV